MVSVGPLKIGNRILCDDIRQEQNNNKHILIGVYSGNIVASQIPAEIQLAFYIEIEAAAGHYDMAIRLSGPQKGEGVVIPAPFDHLGKDVATLASPRFSINMTAEGIFKIDLRVGAGRWKNIISKAVSVNPSALQQPSEKSPPDAPESS